MHLRPLTSLSAALLTALGGLAVTAPAAQAAPPTAVITLADTALRTGETSLVTVTFSEPVLGFSNADLTVANGTLSALTTSDGGTTWTATLTPTPGISDATNLITLDNTGVQNVGGEGGSGTTDSNNYAIDTQRPTASLVVSDSSLKAGETALLTVTFSEAVTGFTNADLTVPNGTLTAVSSSDGGTTWTATFTPTAGITDTSNRITLDNTGVVDAAGNAGSGTTDSNNYAIDTQRPAASIVVADTSIALGETSLVTATFSEAVMGFTNADLTVANGTLSAVSSSDGGITWTATFTPTAGISDATNLITLANTGVADLAGNAGSGTTDSNNYAIDTQRPAATIVVADNFLSADETSLVDFTFSEAVTGFTNADLTVPNGTLSTVSSSDGGITWTATLTPSAGISDATNLITLDNTGVVDAAGNVGNGATDSNNYAIDTQRPTASIVVSDTALRVGETALVTITFSEPVTGFTNADLSVAKGTLSAVSSSDGGMTWTGTFTPTASTTDATNVITLDNTGVSNGAGYPGSGITESNNYAIDTQRPTASLVVSDPSLQAGESTFLTVTFSEEVAGFTTADLTVANGTLNNLSSSDGGITWTAILTASPSTTDASNVVTLDNTGVVDAAGNSGAGTTDSNNYAIDTQLPSATIVVADSSLTAGETTTVTVTFSEAVTGVTTADLTVANGTLTSLSSSDGGITWTATLTPTASTTDPTNVISLDNTGVTDLAGNRGTGTTDSNNYAVATVPSTAPDTARPTSQASAPALDADGTWTVTYTLSDLGSGVASVALYALAPGQPGYQRVDTDALTRDGQFVFTGEAEGTYGFYTVATDMAGNAEDAPATADAVTQFDATAPSSSSSARAATRHHTWTVSYTAADSASGVAKVELWVRSPGAPAYSLAAADTTVQDGQFRYTGSADGDYDFYTVATDPAGNVEAIPARPDATTRLDSSGPALVHRGPDQLILQLGAADPVAFEFRVGEPATLAIRVVRRGETFYSSTKRVDGRVQREWRGRSDGTQVEPGRYRVVAVATDALGNATRTVVPLRVKR